MCFFCQFRGCDDFSPLRGRLFYRFRNDSMTSAGKEDIRIFLVTIIDTVYGSYTSQVVQDSFHQQYQVPVLHHLIMPKQVAARMVCRDILHLNNCHRHPKIHERKFWTPPFSKPLLMTFSTFMFFRKDIHSADIHSANNFYQSQLSPPHHFLPLKKTSPTNQPQFCLRVSGRSFEMQKSPSLSTSVLTNDESSWNWMGYEGGKHGLDRGPVNMLKRHGKLEIDFNDSILITMIVIC